MTAKYMQCPYCHTHAGGHTKKVPKTVGRYRIKELRGNVIILQCQRCMKSFRLRYMGVPLLWEDMSAAEKKAFVLKSWQKKRLKDV